MKINIIKTQMVVKENKKLIYEVQRLQVILDSYLSMFYEFANKTKAISKVVKRHINSFLEKFMNQLTQKEYSNILGFQIETLELEQEKSSNSIEQGVMYVTDIKIFMNFFSKLNLKLLTSGNKSDIIISIGTQETFEALSQFFLGGNYEGI